MKNILLIALINLLFVASATLFGQNQATNIRVKIDAEKADYTFDIPKGTTTKIYSVNLNTNNEKFTPKNIIGGGTSLVVAGNDRKITWNYAADGYKKEDIINLKIQIEARINESASMALFERETGAQLKYNLVKLNTFIFAVGGLSVMSYGLLKEINAKKDYNFYKNNDRRSNAFTGTTRDAMYKKANDQHKNAQILLASGGVLVATATAWFFISRKQYRNVKSIGITQGGFDFVEPNAAGLSLNLLNSVDAPLSLVYKF
jgi:hypothetical protein